MQLSGPQAELNDDDDDELFDNTNKILICVFVFA